MEMSAFYRGGSLLKSPLALILLSGLLFASCYFVPVYQERSESMQSAAAFIMDRYLLLSHDYWIILAMVGTVLALLYGNVFMVTLSGLFSLLMWSADMLTLLGRSVTISPAAGAYLYLCAALLLLLAAAWHQRLRVEKT